MTTYNNNFTHDLEFGNMGEKSIARILELEHTKCEVKTERGDYDNLNSWVNTGNVAIEIECKRRRQQCSQNGVSKNKLFI